MAVRLVALSSTPMSVSNCITFILYFIANHKNTNLPAELNVLAKSTTVKLDIAQEKRNWHSYTQ